MKTIDLSIVMCFRNEGGEPEQTIKSILATCGKTNIEILAIDDCSDVPSNLSRFPRVRCIRNNKRLGVGMSRDFGVDEARSENILIIDAHMRFRQDNWTEKGAAAVETHPTSIFCTKSVDTGSGLFDPEKTVLPMNHGLPSYSGCSLKMFLTQKDYPAKPAGFRNIIESRWEEEKYGNMYPIPCLMGSNYFFKKAWFKKLHGFKGLKTWGNSEPFLSLKSWLAGGHIRLMKDIEIGHLYRRKKPNAVPREHFIYNKAVTAKILFTPRFSDELIDFLGDSPAVRKAKELLKTDAGAIEAERCYFSSITKVPEIDCLKKLHIDYTNPLNK